MTVSVDPKDASPFQLLGGGDTLRAVVERFYDLMESESAYADLRALHVADLSPMRASLTGFLTAWCGGPRDWFEQHPGKCMMSAHRPYAITETIAAQWAHAMGRAIADVAPENAAVAARMAERLAQMAKAMGR